MSTRRSRAPRDHVISGVWPHARLDNDHAAEVAQRIARRLEGVLSEGGMSLRTISRMVGINRQTVVNIVEGRGWATIAVLADLEHTLGVELWPRDLRKTHIGTSSGHA